MSPTTKARAGRHPVPGATHRGAAPKSTRPPGLVTWWGPILTPTSIGAEARGFVKHLGKLGLPLKAVPLQTDRAFAERVGADERELFLDIVASLDLSETHPALAVAHLPAYQCTGRVPRSDYTIARTSWPTTAPHPAMLAGLGAVDEIWVPDAFTERIFREIELSPPIRVFGPGVDAQEFRPGLEPLPVPGRRGVAFVAALDFERRAGWDVLLRAWSRAFEPGDDVCLVLAAWPPGGAGVGDDECDGEDSVLDERLAELGLDRSRIAPVLRAPTVGAGAGAARLLAAADCYVAPARAELSPIRHLQAMACETTVIATRFGGNLELMNDSNALLLDVEDLVRIDARSWLPHHVGQRWAEPSIEHLVALLRRVASDDELRRRIGENARCDVEQRWQWRHAAERASSRLLELLRGVEVGSSRPSPPGGDPRDEPAGPLPARDPARGVGGEPGAGAPGPAPQRGSSTADHRHGEEQVPATATPAVAEAPDARLPEARVIGLFGTPVGLGEAARRTLIALEAAGIVCSTAEIHTNGVEDSVPFAGRVRDSTPDTVAVACINPDILLHLVATQGMAFLDGAYRIGLWHWELETFPERSKPAFSCLDEVWVSSEHTRRVIQAHTHKPVVVMPMPIAWRRSPRHSRGELGLPEGFVFGFSFDFRSLASRKNPAGLVEAFSRAFAPGEGPRLVIKSTGGDQLPADRDALARLAASREDVILLDRQFSPDAQSSFVGLLDCYVSLHRAEGFGLTLAEAMSWGRPVVATGWSGNLDFMTNENSYLVPWRAGKVPEGSFILPAGSMWAEPDIDAAAEILRHIWLHPDEARERGERGRVSIRTTHGIESAAAVARARFEAIAARDRIGER